MSDDEYVRLMYFYRSFFREIFSEAMDLMGRRGVLAILRAAAAKFAEVKLDNYKVAQKDFNTAIRLMLDLGRPEIREEEGMVILKKCPFKTRPSDERPYIEEDVFCTICTSFINGISKYFNEKPRRLVESRVRKSKKCKFGVQMATNTYKNLSIKNEKKVSEGI